MNTDRVLSIRAVSELESMVHSLEYNKTAQRLHYDGFCSPVVVVKIICDDSVVDGLVVEPIRLHIPAYLKG